MKSRRSLFAVVVLVQLACAGFFLWNLLVSVFGLPPINWQFHEVIEIGAALGLFMGLAVSVLLFRSMTRHTTHIEAQLRAASGAFIEIMEERFVDWGLTPAERDVALFAIKGMTTSEIAILRDTSEGTVKAQTNAIYRKAGVGGRPQLLSLFIEELMDGDVTGRAGDQPTASSA